MADIHRIRAVWSGAPGAPGISTFYTPAPPAAADLTAIWTFFNALIAGLPNTMTIQVQGTGDTVDDGTGDLTGSWTATAPSVVTGTSASGYAAPTGSCVHWTTGSVMDGRRVKGTTFIVPTVNQYEANGTLVGTWVTTLTTAAQTMQTALGANFMVWHRPLYGPRPPGGGSRPLLRAGGSANVTGVSVPDKAVVLRSRRD